MSSSDVANPVEPVLIAQGLTRHFTDGTRTIEACQEVSLTVRAGEFVVIRGRSGAGKSTLLSLLAGLERPDSGIAAVADVELTRASERDLVELRRTTLATVPQDFGLLGSLTAAENVEVPLRLLRQDPRSRDRLVSQALEAVGLADHGRQRPEELSGGQQQRVAIARAIVSPRALLLADEPTGSLDSASAARVTDLLHGLARDSGTAVVTTTHDPVVVARADRVLEMHDGRIR
jgi:putative ABC transport system ATP-binding protein